MLNKLIKRLGRTGKGGEKMIVKYISNTQMLEFLIKKLPLSYLTQGMYSTQQPNSGSAALHPNFAKRGDLRYAKLQSSANVSCN